MSKVPILDESGGPVKMTTMHVACPGCDVVQNVTIYKQEMQDHKFSYNFVDRVCPICNFSGTWVTDDAGERLKAWESAQT